MICCANHDLSSSPVNARVQHIDQSNSRTVIGCAGIFVVDQIGKFDPRIDSGRAAKDGLGDLHLSSGALSLCLVGHADDEQKHRHQK